MFWDRLYHLCTKNNFKPNTVAKAIGLSTATATKWKNGSVPNGEALSKIADYLDCSVDYLLGRTDTPQVINFSDKGAFMYNSQETANLIKSLANLKGISISKLLLDCELNKNALYTMQSKGYFPRVEAIAKIADYLDVSVDYLLGKTDIPQVINFPDRGAFMYNSQETVNRIKFQAKKQNISINQLLSNCGLGKSTITKMSNGADILTHNFLKIANYLDCSVDYLLGKTDNPMVNK